MLTMESSTIHRGQGCPVRSGASVWLPEVPKSRAGSNIDVFGKIQSDLEFSIWTEIGRKVLAEIDRVPHNIKQ